MGCCTIWIDFGYHDHGEFGSGSPRTSPAFPLCSQIFLVRQIMTQRIIPNYESLAFSPGLPQLARKTLVNQYFKIYALPCRITSLLSCSSLSLLPVPGCHFFQECLRMKVSTAASSHIAKVQTLQRIKFTKFQQSQNNLSSSTDEPNMSKALLKHFFQSQIQRLC